MSTSPSPVVTEAPQGHEVPATILTVGDGLVSQIPALIVSLAAGLLVSKGGTRGTAEQAVMGQLGAYPRALSVAAALMFLFALVPGLPFVPFMALSGLMAFTAYAIPKKLAAQFFTSVRL